MTQPAKVAPIKTEYPGIRCECASTGVCQAFEPPCSPCARYAAVPDDTARMVYRITVADIARAGAITVLLALGSATVGLAVGVLWRVFGN